MPVLSRVEGETDSSLARPIPRHPAETRTPITHSSPRTLGTFERNLSGGIGERSLFPKQASTPIEHECAAQIRRPASRARVEERT